MKHCAKCKEGSWGMLRLGDRIKLDDSIFDIKELCGKCWYIIINSVQELVRDILNDESTLSSDIVIVEKKNERSEFEKKCDNIKKNWSIVRYIEEHYGDVVEYAAVYGVEKYPGECIFKCPKGRHRIEANHKRDFFYCDACGKGGDVLTYVSSDRECSLIEAIEYLEELTKKLANSPMDSNGTQPI
jgi:hypothetical protein